MNFKYRKFPINPETNPFSNKKSSLRPVIQIGFEVPDGNFHYFVLIDSGADYCMFHAKIGEMLGLDIKVVNHSLFMEHQVNHRRHIFTKSVLK